MDPHRPGIPRNAIVNIDTTYWYPNGKSKDFVICHVLLQNGHALVIQSPGRNWTMQDTLKMSEDDYAAPSRTQLAEIERVIKTIDFFNTRWAYLVPDRDGQNRIVAKNFRPLEIKCDVWAEYVDEDDIHILVVHHSGSPMTGLWRGKEVAIRIAYEPSGLEYVENEAKAHYAMRNLNLAPKLLAHVTRDGRVIGYITEPIKGRMIEYRDRMKVFQAYVQLQQNGLIFRSGMPQSSIMICNGRVLFTQMQCMYPVPLKDRHLLDKLAEEWHWYPLQKAFDELSHEPNDQLPHELLKMDFHPLVPPPDPEYRVSLMYMGFDLQLICMVRWYLKNKAQVVQERKKAARRQEKTLFDGLYLTIEGFLPSEYERPPLPYLTGPPSVPRSHYRPYKASGRPRVRYPSYDSERTESDPRYSVEPVV